VRRRDLVAALVGGAIVMVLAGGVAWAAIPSDGSVYTACMLKNVGTVRLIDKSLPAGNLMSRCKPALEIEVSWNQEGQQGIAGQPGSVGAKGDKGDTGEPGQNGAVGQPGEQGARGEPGAQGEPGIQGPKGDPGALAGYEIVRTFGSAQENELFTLTAPCPAGKQVVGGGGLVGAASLPLFEVQFSRPASDGSGWLISGYNGDPVIGVDLSVWAICVNA
jgi:Collagen triple helix repeat (20 copies)